MKPDCGGNPGRQQHIAEHGRQQPHDGVRAARTPEQVTPQRSRQQQRDGCEEAQQSDIARDIVPGLVPALHAGCERGDHGDHQPSQHVGKGGGRQGDERRRGAGQAQVHHDAGHHRHGGDRQGDAAKQHIGQRGHAHPQRRQRQLRDAATDGERYRDPQQRHQHRHPQAALGAHLFQVQVQAELEHQQHQPQFAESGQHGRHLGCKHGAIIRAAYRAQDRWAEQQSGRDLAHHPALADAPGTGAAQACGQDDETELNNPHADFFLMRNGRDCRAGPHRTIPPLFLSSAKRPIQKKQDRVTGPGAPQSGVPVP